VSTAIVIGYGSIGRRHAAALRSRGAARAHENRRAEIRERACLENPGSLVADSLEGLEGRVDFSTAAAVIASWGPSHRGHFDELAQRGVRRILCEKPMASSVEDARAMARRAESEGIWLGVNHTLRYARLEEALAQEAASCGLGQPRALVLEGGAACLATNGIHWLDFAGQIFGAAPRRAASTAAGERINPRAPDLEMFGGSAIFEFDGGREAAFLLSNRSSISHTARVLYRDAAAELRYVAAGEDAVLHSRIARRDPEAVRKYPAVTRTGPAAQVLREGALPATRSFAEGLADAAEELLAAPATSPRCPAAAGVRSVEALVAALESSRLGTSVDLPLPDGAAARRPWAIS
jgi:predicted dehydrogenase